MLTSSVVLLVGAAVLVLVIVLVVVLLRRRGPRLAIEPLAAPDAERYVADFEVIEAMAAERPQQSAARARGLVEEVLRRMGFPDRLDSAQKAKDVGAYDREVARILAQADVAIRGAGNDAQELAEVVGLYRQALDRLLPRTELEHV